MFTQMHNKNPPISNKALLLQQTNSGLFIHIINTDNPFSLTYAKAQLCTLSQHCIYLGFFRTLICLYVSHILYLYYSKRLNCLKRKKKIQSTIISWHVLYLYVCCNNYGVYTRKTWKMKIHKKMFIFNRRKKNVKSITT
jgi:hypothetical protein